MFDPTFASTRHLPTIPYAISSRVSEVPCEIISYLSQLGNQMEVKPVSEINLISESVISELSISYSKHLVGICSHYEGSKSIEKFLSLSSSFLLWFSTLLSTVFCEAELISLMEDKIGSHVLQSFIVECRPLLKDNNFNADVFNSLQHLSTLFFEKDLIFNQNASHVLRSFLVTLSGKPIYYEYVFSPGFSSEIPLEALPQENDSPVVDFYQQFLVSFIASLSLEYDETFFNLLLSQYTSPIIQILLISERAFSYEAFPVPFSLTDRLAKLIHDEDSFRRLYSNKVSSRALEAFVYASKSSLLEEFIHGPVLNNVGDLVKDEYGNFLIQAIFIHSTSKDAILELFEHISTHCKLFSNRIGILFKMVTSPCLPLSISLPFLLRTIKNKKFSLLNEKNISLRILRLSPLVKKDKRNRSVEFHPVGCAILVYLFTNILTHHSKPFLKSFIKVTTDILCRLGMEPSGSKVLEAFFTSRFIKDKYKLRIFKRFIASSLVKSPSSSAIITLCMDPYGYRVIASAFFSLPMEYKVAIAYCLTKNINSWRKKGKIVKTFLLEEFIYSQEKWIKLIMEKEKQYRPLVKC